MSKEFGQVLKSLRKQCELTQKQVADALHIDRSTYAYYESGTTEPDLKSIPKLARIFNVDPILLLPNDDGRPSISVADVNGSGPKRLTPDEEFVLDIKDEKIYSIAKDERGLLVLYRTLSPEQKEKFKDFAQKLHWEEE